MELPSTKMSLAQLTMLTPTNTSCFVNVILVFSVNITKNNIYLPKAWPVTCYVYIWHSMPSIDHKETQTDMVDFKFGNPHGQANQLMALRGLRGYKTCMNCLNCTVFTTTVKKRTIKAFTHKRMYISIKYS